MVWTLCPEERFTPNVGVQGVVLQAGGGSTWLQGLYADFLGIIGGVIWQFMAGLHRGKEKT
jgi:hypothetical protein